MLTQIINGHILTPQGWLKDGSVLISDGKILEVTNSDLAVIGATVIDAKGMYIVPGFVSMHVHGGAGHDFTEGTTEAFQKATQAHLAHGATSIFPTLSSTSFDNIKRAVTTCEELMKAPGNIIQGLHIEGPYLNKKNGWCTVGRVPERSRSGRIYSFTGKHTVCQTLGYQSRASWRT